MIIEDWNLPHPLLNKMQSQTLCTISEASTPSTQLRLARLFKPKQIFPESNGSYNFKANTKHRYGTINTAPTMNDHNEINSNKKEPGRQMCIVETASADSGNTPEIRDYPTMRNREQRKAYRRMLAEVEENVRKQITEDDLHKIFSAPMEKRHSRTSTVNSPDIVWSYIPREHDGMTIDLFTASTILRGVSDSVLRQKLRKIPGYAEMRDFRQPDDIWRYVVRYHQGSGFSLPIYLQDLPLVTIEEIVRTDWKVAGTPTI